MKTDINPMQRLLAAPPTASSQGSPASRRRLWAGRYAGGRRGGGAPSGKRNGNYRHGGRTIETIALKAEIRDLVRESRELLKQID